MLETANRKELACQTCGAVLHVDDAQRTITCPYCDSHTVIERPAAQSPDPRFVVGFIVQQKQAVRAVKQWIASRGFFTRSDFKRAALEKTRGVYVPAYLYGAIAESQYSVDIGENYTVTTDDGTETRTEWRSLTGRFAAYVYDVLVTASSGVPNLSLEGLEPFNLGELRRYDPKLISGWAAEEPTLDAETCFRLAHDEAQEKVGRLLHDFMPGDKLRDLRHETRVRDETVDLVLLPIWTFAVRYHEEKPPVQILVNGQTGKIHGAVPKSTLKIALVVLAVVLVLIGLFALLDQLVKSGHM